MKHRVLAWILVMGLLLALVPVYAETIVEGALPETQVTEETADEPSVDGAVASETPEKPEEPVAPSPETPEEPEAPEESTPNEDEETEVPDKPSTDETEEQETPEIPETEAPEEGEEPADGMPVPPRLPADEVLVMPVPFYAEVRIEFKHEGGVFFGDEVMLRAIVDANKDEYTVVWQYYNEAYDEEDEESEEWLACGDGKTLSFTVTQETAERIFRAVVNEEFTSETFTLPKVSEKPKTEEPVDPDEDKKETEVGNREEAEPKIPSAYPYEYVRDENGELVLDEAGNPIAIVPEGVDIPVEFLRDEEGNLVLDEDGNPIPTQFVPQTAHKVSTLEDMLDSNRSIDIYADWGEGNLFFGAESTLIAVLHGYDNAVYGIQWQTSVAGGEWVDVEGATQSRYTMTVTEDNYLDYWRVVVTITDVIESESAPDASV